MARELEIKLDVRPGSALADGGAAAADLAGIHAVRSVRAGRPRRLDATYWDTAGRDLLRAGATLRRRLGDADVPRWTLKLPASSSAGGAALDRHEHEVDDPATTPPSSLVAAASAVTTDPLEVVGRLRTDRTVLELVGTGGAVLVEVADDHVLAEVPGRPPRRWHELEVELVGEAPEVILEEVAVALRAAGAVDGDPRPKLARALALDEVAPGVPTDDEVGR